MMADFVERWVAKGEELAARHAAEAGTDLSAAAAAQVEEARREAVSGDAARAAGSPADATAFRPAVLLESVSGRFRARVTQEPRSAEALAALALQYSRAAGELAGSPT